MPARTLVIIPGLVVAIIGCGRGPAPPLPPLHNQQEDAVTSTELAVVARWTGPIYLAADDQGVEGLAIRDPAGYDALLARLPERRVQMKQPAPLSDDPLRGRPPIDFATHMLVVVVRGQTLSPPVLARVVREPGRLVVRYAAPTPPPEARPTGVGGYSAVLVPRAEGRLELIGPRIIDDPAAVAAAVGDLVTLRGTMARTRIPTLLGVDVDEGGAAGGARAEATGWLHRYQVTQAEIDATIAATGQYAHRGAGDFWRLTAPVGAGLAPARPVW